MASKPLRDILGEALLELGARDKNVVVLDADLASATRSIFFAREHKERFFNVGIAEQNMVSIAAGLSTCGLIPYACTFSFLLTLRALDQIRSQVCYPGLDVRLMGTNGGLSGFGDGATHQSVLDIAILRALPGMTTIVPSDGHTLRQMVFESAGHKGPLYIRVPRVGAPAIHHKSVKIKIGKGIMLRRGTDITIAAMGMMVWRALEAADRLKEDGINAEVIEIHTIKPFDEKIVTESVKKTGALVTAEEHSRYGGLHSAACEAVSRTFPVPSAYVAIEDRFGESGPYEELMDKFGLNTLSIVDKCKSVLKHNRRK